MVRSERAYGRRGGVALRVLLCVLAGCLLPKPPPSPRYFAPGPSSGEPQGPPVAVRLGIVRSPIYLREQMTWRRSDVEYGFYEQRRWTELPATYVERALVHELSPTGGTAVGGTTDAPLVTVTLRAFEDVLTPVHEARVALAVEVEDARCVGLRRTFAATRPLATNEPEAVASGIGEALDDVVREVGVAVRRAVAERGHCGT
jgi:ABC-type uncharacterized transport system auxiliary subunit